MSREILSGLLKSGIKMDEPGIEPGAFRMQSECDTTSPHTLLINTRSILAFKLDYFDLFLYMEILSQKLFRRIFAHF